MSYRKRSYKCSVYKWETLYFKIWDSVSLTGFDILGQCMAFGGASNGQKLGVNALYPLSVWLDADLIWARTGVDSMAWNGIFGHRLAPNSTVQINVPQKMEH